MTEVRNRVRELRFVPAGSLLPDLRNWRTHPTYQREALRFVLEKIGFADALAVREQDGDLILIDGHLRAEDADPEQIVPVLILDLDEDEAGIMLATFDPIGAMAQAEELLLTELIGMVSDPLDEQFNALLTMVDGEITKTATLPPPEPQAEQEREPDPEPRPPPPTNNNSSGEIVIITFRMSQTEYEDKMEIIAEAVSSIGVTPHIQRIQ